MYDKIKHVILTVLKWLASPIWFPWKVLFVRKPEKKFKVVDKKTQIFRIVRSPITKPLKFIVFLLIIIIEISIVYKIKVFVGAPFIRTNVQDYYRDEFLKDLDDEQKSIISAKYEEMFKKVDEMPNKAKNNFYAVLDSDAAKIVLKDVKPEVTEYLLDKFNEDEKTREIIQYNVQNMNTIIPEYIKEVFNETDCIPSANGSVDKDDTATTGGTCDEVSTSPLYTRAIALTTKGIDTHLLLDVAGSVLKTVEKNCEDCQSIGNSITTKNVDEGLMILEYIYEQR